MLQRAKPWQSYSRVATQTASPGQLVLMLYDGALRFLERARAGFDHDDPKERNEAINNGILRAQTIFMELDRSLNMDQGGQVAATLRSLYDYFDRRLQESNVAKSPEGIIEVIQRVTVLRDAWIEMLRQGDPASGTAFQARTETPPPHPASQP
jgi:flagellar protein FliS